MFLLFSPAILSSTIIHVPDNQPTIQAGIDAAINGDTVLVESDIYVENINFNGKNIIVGSHFLTSGDASFIASTIIDGDSSGSVVTFSNGENSAASITGFTIINGFAFGGSGGIYCINSNPSIYNNCITENSFGVYCENSNPEIQGNLIYGNSGGICCRVNSHAAIISNTIAHNDCVGIECSNSDPVIINNILWLNECYYGEELNVYGTSSPMVIYCNIRGGWVGVGNIDANPLFTDPHNGNFNVCAQSPCIDAGDPGMSDPDESRSDIGAFFPDHPECFAGNIRYVSATGDDTTGDGSFENPFKTIQHAVDVSTYGDTVVVENGIYDEAVTVNSKSIVLMSDYLFTEDTLDIQNTIIGGDLIITVVSFEYCDSVTSIIGFEIKNAVVDDNWYQCGISCTKSSPIIQNNNICNNIGQGITCMEFSNPQIENNLISGNSRSGIYCRYGSDPLIENNTISGNAASGVHCMDGADPTISMNNIVENSQSRAGGGICCIQYCDPTIAGNTITGNTAASGGGIFCELNSDPQIKHNVIRENSADYGGGINIQEGSNPIVDSNLITDNVAYIAGGGLICVQYSHPTIINNIISTNSADTAGGGIFCYWESSPAVTTSIITGNTAVIGGAIICERDCNPTITATTISGNSADSIGSGIGCGSSSFPAVENSIIAFGTDGEAVWCDETGGISINCSNIYGNAGGDWTGCIADQADINGNFSLDPLFCDTAKGDFNLENISPCVPAYNDCGVLIGALSAGCSSTDINDDYSAETLPVRFSLSQNYPNPFNPVTTIDYSLERRLYVEITIHNLLGRRVKTVVNKVMPAGTHTAYWDGVNSDGEPTASGIYFYQIKARNFVETKKMVLLK